MYDKSNLHTKVQCEIVSNLLTRRPTENICWNHRLKTSPTTVDYMRTWNVWNRFTTVWPWLLRPRSSVSLNASVIIRIRWGVKVKLSYLCAYIHINSIYPYYTSEGLLTDSRTWWNNLPSSYSFKQRGGNTPHISLTNIPKKKIRRSKVAKSKTYFLVAWGKSSSSCVRVCIASVWPEGRVTLPLPLRDAGILVVIYLLFSMELDEVWVETMRYGMSHPCNDGEHPDLESSNVTQGRRGCPRNCHL